jgi:hypothetical protein
MEKLCDFAAFRKDYDVWIAYLPFLSVYFQLFP